MVGTLVSGWSGSGSGRGKGHYVMWVEILVNQEHVENTQG